MLYNRWSCWIHHLYFAITNEIGTTPNRPSPLRVQDRFSHQAKQARACGTQRHSTALPKSKVQFLGLIFMEAPKSRAPMETPSAEVARLLRRVSKSLTATLVEPRFYLWSKQRAELIMRPTIVPLAVLICCRCSCCRYCERTPLSLHELATQ